MLVHAAKHLRLGVPRWLPVWLISGPQHVTAFREPGSMIAPPLGPVTVRLRLRAAEYAPNAVTPVINYARICQIQRPSRPVTANFTELRP